MKQDDVLTLTFPARTGYLRICRITTTAFAVDLGFDVDELDDLRLAVDEATTWLMLDEESGGMVRLALDGMDGQLWIKGERQSEAIPPRDVDDLVHAILGATLDSYELVSQAGQRSIELKKAKFDG